MSTIQNLKNFIRHGKQARDSKSPPDQPAVSNVHAQQQRYNNYGNANTHNNNNQICDQPKLRKRFGALVDRKSG